MQEKTRIITLTLTQACNLSCIYCYETHKSSKRMSFETAKAIIDSEMKKISEDETLEIDLFGGEPLLEFSLIKEIVLYVRTAFPKKNAIFFIVTNGTLLTEEIKQWLVDNEDCVICGLSFDGTKQMQDINRSNSFDLVDLDFFAKQYPGQTVKMTVSNQTLDTLAEGVLFLQNKGFEVTCNLAYGIDWSNQAYREVLERELMKLIEYYLIHPEMPICSMLDMGIERVASQETVGRYCGAGLDMASYDVDGIGYPCQMFMPLSAGQEKANASHEIHFFEDDIPEELQDKKCKDCVIKSICPTCYGSNYISTGNIYIHDDSNCDLMKIIMKARAYLKGMLWKNGSLKLSEAEEALLLRSILILQRELD